MFYYKTSVLLCNCFLFPYFYLLQRKTYHQSFSSPIQTLKLIPRHISAGYIMPLRLRSPRHHAPDSIFLPHYAPGKHTSLHRYPCFAPTTLSPHSRLRNVLRSFAHTVSLPLRSGSALTQALPCSPCPPPPHSPSLPIYFFSKFSFPCGSIRSLKSAFIIGGLSVLGEQVKTQTMGKHSAISFSSITNTPGNQSLMKMGKCSLGKNITLTV